MFNRLATPVDWRVVVSECGSVTVCDIVACCDAVVGCDTAVVG